MEIFTYAFALFLGLIVGLPIAGIVIGLILVKFGPAILTKTTLNLVEKAIPLLPERVQRYIEARRPKKTVEGTAIPVPNQAHRLPSPRRSGQHKGGDPMRGNAHEPRNAYDPDADNDHSTPQPARITVSKVTDWAKEAPALAVFATVMIVSLILNPILSGWAILWQPLIFLWMELLIAALSAGIIYLGIQLHQFKAAQHSAEPAIDTEFLEDLKKVLGHDELSIEEKLQSLKPAVQLDGVDKEVLDGIRNVMSGEELNRFLTELLRVYESGAGTKFDRNPQPRGWGVPPRRRRQSPLGERADSSQL